MKHILALCLWLASATLALAQGCGPTNPNCIVPTAPPGTSNNQAASTAFVQQAITGGSAQVPSCPSNGITDATACIQAAINQAVSVGVPLWIGLNNAKYAISSTLTSAGVIDLEGFAPVGNDGVANAQTCLNGFVAVGNITLLHLTGPKVVVRNICFQMHTPGAQPTAGAAIQLGGADQGHDDISGNTIFWPFDGIQLGAVSSELVRASNVSRNVIRSPRRYGIAIGMGTSGGATAGITLHDNQIGCDSGATGTGFALFDGAVSWDGTNNGPNNCVYGTAIIPGNGQNINGEFMGVVGDSDVVADLLVAPTSGGTINFLNFTRAWFGAVNNPAAPAAGTQAISVNCPAGTFCSEFIFNGITAHGGQGNTSQIVNLTRGGGGPISVTLANSTICTFGTPGAGEIGLNLNFAVPQFGRWVINNNKIGQQCLPATGASPTTSTAISINSPGGGTSDLVITGNNLQSDGTPLAFTFSGTFNSQNVIIRNNLGVDNLCPAVASAASITVPNAATCINVTGTTAITTVIGAWRNREVRLIAESGLTLSAAGGMPGFCSTSTTLGAAQTSILIWDDIHACWSHIP